MNAENGSWDIHVLNPIDTYTFSRSLSIPLLTFPGAVRSIMFYERMRVLTGLAASGRLLETTFVELVVNWQRTQIRECPFVFTIRKCIYSHFATVLFVVCPQANLLALIGYNSVCSIGT